MNIYLGNTDKNYTYGHAQDFYEMSDGSTKIVNKLVILNGLKYSIGNETIDVSDKEFEENTLVSISFLDKTHVDNMITLLKDIRKEFE